MPKKKNFIQKAHIKKGALHRQLKISPKKTIPRYLLEDIKHTRSNGYVWKYGANGSTKRIKVTPLLKKRVNFALNIRRRK